jgi:DNA-binding protein Fis
MTDIKTKQTALGDAIQNLIKSRVDTYFKNIKDTDHQPAFLHEIVLSEVESGLIESALQLNNYRIDKAADTIGISIDEFRSKLDKYGF